MARTIPFIILCWSLTASFGTAHSADRDKLLSEPGVYGTFAVFQIDDEWWKHDKAARSAATAAVKEVFQKHTEKVAVDTYLSRGLSDRADVFVRLHAKDLIDNQNLLLEVMSTPLGRHLTNTYTFNGITKALNYVPGFPEDLKTALKSPTEPGPKLYAIVIPIRKDAEWWLLDRETRTSLMKEHTEASVPYLKTVKRKLYHASGLDDLDFITYFETTKLDDFHNLILALEQVKENRHNRRFGHPTLLGTIRPLDELLEILAR
ncbi:MAG TPA: chlorite dismutase family protein [Nitrospiraceae bacterium]|nr:chlorite dismutase family protein [Nitrospiraceae bacterium]